MKVIISGILPSQVAAAEALADDPLQPLMPDEEALLGRACEKRRREFITGRNCARTALARLGVSAQTILSGTQREPVWPAGVVGSITHCPGYRAAVVARKEDFLSLGVDAEIHERLPAGIGGLVMSREEQESFDRNRGTLHWDRILFSAKESAYKAWFPITKQWLDFHDVTIAFDPPRHTFRATLLNPLVAIGGEEIHYLDGHFLVESGLIVTLVTVDSIYKKNKNSVSRRDDLGTIHAHRFRPGLDL